MVKLASELSYSIRLRVVLKYFGQLCLIVAALTVVPLGVSLVAGETEIALRYGIVLVALATVGGLLSRLRAPERIQTNEAMVLVALVFLLIPLLMAYPLMASGLSFPDAFFEAVSAATTTGLSTLPAVADKPGPFLFARAWMQWYGGLGIVILSLALLIQPGLTAKRLAVTETIEDDLVGGTRAHARRILVIYGSLTGLGIGVLWLLGGDLFNAVLYTFSAISTGGFAPHDHSLQGLNGWPLQWAVTLLCVAGSIPLALYHRPFLKGGQPLLKDLQLRALLAAGLAVAFFLAASLRIAHGMSWSEALCHAPLLAFSAQTTAGFSTFDLTQLDPLSKLLLIPAMAIGGGMGSTAGGFKILRLLILLRLLQATLIRTCLPLHAVLDPRLEGKRLQDSEIHEALSIILLFTMVVTLSWLPFVAMGHDPLDSLFEVVSATGTVGLSVGVAARDLATPLKGVLCVDMLMGRLEMVAWLVLFFPRTWFGK